MYNIWPTLSPAFLLWLYSALVFKAQNQTIDSKFSENHETNISILTSQLFIKILFLFILLSIAKSTYFFRKSAKKAIFVAQSSRQVVAQSEKFIFYLCSTNDYRYNCLVLILKFKNEKNNKNSFSNSDSKSSYGKRDLRQ